MLTGRGSAHKVECMRRVCTCDEEGKVHELKESVNRLDFITVSLRILKEGAICLPMR